MYTEWARWTYSSRTWCRGAEGATELGRLVQLAEVIDGSAGDCGGRGIEVVGVVWRREHFLQGINAADVQAYLRGDRTEYGLESENVGRCRGGKVVRAVAA